MADTPLAGVGVLVTRARHQAAALVNAIERQGGNAIQLPAIEIRARPDDDVQSQLRQLPAADITIFVSPNAVEYGVACADDADLAAIGPATAAALNAQNRKVDIVPAAGYDSEHLLGEAALNNLDGKVVRIVRAQSGRELLGTTLEQRGARVDYVSVYDRVAPQYDPATLDPMIERWRDGEIDVVSIMSIETLNNLTGLLDESTLPLFAQTPLVTPAVRVLKEAMDRFPGIPVTLAEGTDADAVVRAIIDLELADDANE